MHGLIVSFHLGKAGRLKWDPGMSRPARLTAWSSTSRHVHLSPYTSSVHDGDGHHHGVSACRQRVAAISGSGKEKLSSDARHIRGGWPAIRPAVLYAVGLRVGFLRSLVHVPSACSYSSESGPKNPRMPLKTHVVNVTNAAFATSCFATSR